MRSGALAAAARQASLCAYLSAILLPGLAPNATLGWWWADPIAAVTMVPIIAKKGSKEYAGKGRAATTAARDRARELKS